MVIAHLILLGAWLDGLCFKIAAFPLQQMKEIQQGPTNKQEEQEQEQTRKSTFPQPSDDGRYSGSCSMTRLLCHLEPARLAWLRHGNKAGQSYHSQPASHT